MVKPLGRVQGLEPRCLVRRGVTERPERLETLADAVDVGEVHELDLRVEVVLGALHAASPGSVADRCGVTPRVHNEHPLDLVPGRSLG